MVNSDKADAIGAAMRLLRAARAGSLATVADGQPFASLVTPASAPDGSLLMLLSGLSPHTRHLREEGRCSLLLMGAPTGPNPQTAPRISLTGTAAPEPSAALKARWVALHPYAAFYAGLGDFQLWRFRVDAAQFVGGFASAHRFRAADLEPDAAAVDAIEAAEPGVIAHCNDDHASAMDVIATAHGGVGPGWQMVAADVDGCDLARDEVVLRVPWAGRAATPGDLRQELVRLATAARNSIAPAAGPGL